MKKIIIVILLLLPFVLSIMISLTGKIISLAYVIPVESINFVNEFDEEVNDQVILKIDEEYTMRIKILPTLASNKEYTLIMDEKYNTICSINDNIIKGISHGFAEIIVVSSYDRDIVDKLMIKVSDENVQSITLPKETLSLKVGQIYDLVATVLPVTATNKLVYYTSSNPECLSIDANGRIIVKQYIEDNITITATSADNENIIDTCIITLIDSTDLNLVFNSVKNGETVWIIDTNSVDLLEFISYNELIIDGDDIVFTKGDNASGVCELEGSILTVNVQNRLFQIVATWTSGEDKEIAVVWIRFTA